MNVTNHEFLAVLYRDAPEGSRGHVTGFAADPDALARNRSLSKKAWRGESLPLPLNGECPHPVGNPTFNNYAAMGIYTSAQRRKIDVAGICAIFIDDLGTKGASKIDPQSLPLAPSWLLETAPGNFQAGYLLQDPQHVDLEQWETVAAAIAEQHGDKGACDLTRYMRLPVGTNTKAKYGEPFRHVLHEFEADRRYTLADIAGAFNVNSQPRSHTKGHDAEAGTPQGWIEDILSGDNYHDALIRLAARCVAKGLSKVETIEILRGLMERSEHSRDERWRARYGSIEECVASAFAKGYAPEGTEQRPEVRIVAGESIALCRELAARIAHARAPLYRRGPLLMRATRITNAEQDEIQRARDALILQRVSPAILMGDVSACVNLTKWNERAKAHVPADLPDRIARAFIEHAPELIALPAVSGITESPIMLPDGALVTTPGHDARTGLIFDAGAIDWRTLRVPDQPSADDVRGAVEMLGDPLRDFPFVSDTDRAVALSAIITAVLRPQLPAAPLHGINATAPGTGKTLLANVVGMIATGRPVPAMAMGESAEEFAKRIDSALLAADPVALIDNVSRPIAGDTACINLTSSRVRVRILGRSEQVEIPAKTFWMATGNNLTFRGDMTRRVLLCTLDAGVERPDLREFARDLLAWVPIHRLRLLSAVFTLLRGFIGAGSPKQGLAPLGGFEAWTRRVRDALVWAGLPDVLGSTESIRNDDPELQQRVAIYQAWHTTNGAEWRQVRDIKHAVRRTEEQTAGCVAHEIALAEELAGIGPGARFDARGFVYWLRSNKGRIAGGLRLESKMDRKTKVQAWRVAPVGGG